MATVPPSGNPKSHEDDDYRILTKDEYKLTVEESGCIINSEWVGYEDLVDFRQFTVRNPGSLFFNLSDLTQKVALTVYSLKSNGSLKKLTSLSTSKAKETKNILLDEGTYYVKVEYKGSSKVTGTSYNVGVIADLFTKRNNADDEYKNGALPQEYTVSLSGSMNLIEKDWVGYGDSIDARRLVLNSAGAYRFFLSDLSNKVKLTVYSVSQNRDGSEKLKKLTSISASSNKKKGTKELFLNSGDYYITIEASSWKKGYNTDYSVNADGVAYTKGNNTDDTWDAAGVKTFTVNGTVDRFVNNEWVGFGDLTDWFRVEVGTPGYYNFNMQDISEKTRMTVYTISETGKKKKLGSVTLSPSKTNSALLKNPLLLDRGTYYISMESVNGKKGANTDYALSAIAGELFVKADNGWNNEISGAGQISASEGIRNDWVGLGDKVDYFFFTAEENTANYTFSFNAQAGMANLRIFIVNGKSQKTLEKLKAGETSVLDLTKLKVSSGTRVYLEITSADSGKGKKNTDYDVLIVPRCNAVESGGAVVALSASNELNGIRDGMQLA